MYSLLESCLIKILKKYTVFEKEKIVFCLSCYQHNEEVKTLIMMFPDILKINREVFLWSECSDHKITSNIKEPSFYKLNEFLDEVLGKKRKKYAFYFPSGDCAKYITHDDKFVRTNSVRRFSDEWKARKYAEMRGFEFKCEVDKYVREWRYGDIETYVVSKSKSNNDETHYPGIGMDTNEDLFVFTNVRGDHEIWTQDIGRIFRYDIETFIEPN